MTMKHRHRFEGASRLETVIIVWCESKTIRNESKERL